MMESPAIIAIGGIAGFVLLVVLMAKAMSGRQSRKIATTLGDGKHLKGAYSLVHKKK